MTAPCERCGGTFGVQPLPLLPVGFGGGGLRVPLCPTCRADAALAFENLDETAPGLLDDLRAVAVGDRVDGGE